MTDQPSSQRPITPLEWYAIFCGDINLTNAQKFSAGIATAMHSNLGRLHLLFHTWGGSPGDGVFIYNLLKQVPLEVVLYNSGQVASAGVIAYLGAKFRKTTANGMFMIHRTHSTLQFANADKLKSASDSVALDDARTHAIFRQDLKLPKKIWTQLKHHDVYIPGRDAVEYGLADEIAEFAPPVGTKVLNALG